MIIGPRLWLDRHRATDWGALRPLVWVAILYTAVAASSMTVFLVQFATMRLPIVQGHGLHLPDAELGADLGTGAGPGR